MAKLVHGWQAYLDTHLNMLSLSRAQTHTGSYAGYSILIGTLCLNPVHTPYIIFSTSTIFQPWANVNLEGEIALTLHESKAMKNTNKNTCSPEELKLWA